MTVEKIKEILARKAVIFSCGGFRPSVEQSESWMGNVNLFREEESIPIDDEGLPMIPLMQLNLEKISFVPTPLEGIKLLTIFISQKLPCDVSSNGSNWIVREYRDLSEVKKKEVSDIQGSLKPFPLKSRIISKDFPIWEDTYSFPSKIDTEILRLEEDGIIGDYFDEFEVHFEHKLGGYPTYCQAGVYFGEGFEFVLQIMSDPKVGISIGHSGILFFAKNKVTGEWRLYWDCY